VIFHPPILALTLVSLLSAAAALWASVFAVELLRRWDLASGAQEQVLLERQTYLVSTVMALVLTAELASLVLFVFNADRMSVMFVGAMCAVGTLNASVFGFPALIAKLGVFFAAGLWLAVNHADNLGRDYPLIRMKYRLLLAVAPLVVLAAGLQLAYFLDLKADTITSCCGKMFAPDKQGLSSEIAGIGERTALFLLYGGLGLLLAAGGAALCWKRSFVLYGAWSAAFFVIAIVAVVSVISLYVYEHPHHHCPFCLLKREYHYFGFALYAPLFAGTALGLSAGFLGFLRQPSSLGVSMPELLRRLTLVSMACFSIFGAIGAWVIWTSKLILFA
jgi:hypothetical protein